jgi:formamidopyrimidine-DNA glycosylase
VPELPELTVYAEALRPRVVGRELQSARVRHPFFVRTAEPPLSSIEGSVVVAVDRRGKRIVIELEGERYLIMHLMLAGRLRWREQGASIPGKAGLAAFDFPNGTLLVTEHGSQKRASLHLIEGADTLSRLLPDGIDPLSAAPDEFRAAITAENHTLKRALTDQRLIAGIGNTYSDEILHRARLSPFRQTGQLSDDELEGLRRATRETLEHWIDVLRTEAGDSFPEKVDAIRPDRAVHGRHRQPCPVCGAPVQRIVYARGECNYCARCQTGGKVLSDRAMSRLLKDDWPSTIDELEERGTGLR